MTQDGNDERAPVADSSGADADRSARVARLEQALAAEARTSASLRAELDALARKVESMAQSFEQRLAEARARDLRAAERLADQQTRLEALGNGREETMRALADARAQLRVVKAERDQLREQLDRVEGMQTATLTLPDDMSSEEPGIHLALPSLEELMASLGTFDDGSSGGSDDGSRGGDRGHLLKHVEAPPEESQEMIAPELVFPEEYGAAKPGGSSTERPSALRVLVLLDAEQPIKYPLYKSVMTIGRSELADIHINSDFVSRVHARVISTDEAVTVEDVSSKNGIRINSEQTALGKLRHGDVLGVGRLRFTFIDTASVDPD
jgi:hypothetical protein